MNELIKCRRQPWYFLTAYVRTLDRSRGELPFPAWPYLNEFTEALRNNRFLVVLKARQMMFTWTVAAYSLWECIFMGRSDTIIISRRSAEAKELLRRIYYVYQRLPEFLQPALSRKTAELMEFAVRGSRLLSVPATPDTGRMYSPRRVIWDEMAFTPYSEEIYSALKPGLDADGSFVGISTPNGPYTLHGRLCLGSPKNGFTLIKSHWRDHPERNERWRKQMMRGISVEKWKREYELDLSLGGKRIYEKFTDENILPEFPAYKEHRVFRAIDFGYRTPVCLWFCLSAEDTLIFFHEWIGQDNTTAEMRERIVQTDRQLGLDEDTVELTFCDPAGAAKADDGISAVEKLRPYIEKIFYRKSNIMPGIDLVREYVCGADGKRRLCVTENCTRLIADFRQYARKDNSEEPKKDGITDHTMDALRYAVVCLKNAEEYPPETLLKGLVSGSSVSAGTVARYASGQQSLFSSLYHD